MAAPTAPAGFVAAAAPTRTTVFLSDGTTGRCFGERVGLTRLRAILEGAGGGTVRVVERPLSRRETAAAAAAAGGAAPAKKRNTETIPLGSGRYPYARFVGYLWRLVRAELERGPVLLVVYSFSCRAVSLMLSALDQNDLALVRQNLRGVVFVAPPNKHRFSKNDRVTIEDDGDLDSDWAQGYGVFPRELPGLPVHFVVGAKCPAKLRNWTCSLRGALSDRGCSNTQYHEIPEAKGVLVHAEMQLAAYIQTVLDGWS
jgi:hypothetical protein